MDGWPKGHGITSQRSHLMDHEEMISSSLDGVNALNSLQPSVLRHRWFGNRNDMWPARNLFKPIPE